MVYYSAQGNSYANIAKLDMNKEYDRQLSLPLRIEYFGALYFIK